MSGHTVHQFARIWSDDKELEGVVDPWGIERRLLIPRVANELPAAHEVLEGQIITVRAHTTPAETYVCHGDGNGAFAWVKLA